MRVLVVYCHPDPESFVAAAHASVLRGLATAGHDVRTCDLYREGFDPAMTPDERRTHDQPGVGPELQAYADDLAWAQALVLVYPTWWSGQPAMLKGWIDRVWVAGVAWNQRPDSDRIAPGLRNIRRIVTVTTHGSSKLVNALEGEAGKRTMTRVMRAMCSRRTRTTWCALYGVDRCTPEARTRFLDRVEAKMSKLR